ncbi:MAG: hypothetical protein ACUZ9M_00300 [Candidatus Scalindua sp.]
MCDNGSGDSDLLCLAKVVQQYENVELIFRKQSAPGSIGHGEAMDILVSKVETPYFVTMDSDASFLLKHWDELLLSRLNEKVKAIGTQAPGDKPKDFPLMFAVLYEAAAFRSSDAKFLPDMDAFKSGNLTDTGWEIRERFLASAYVGEVLEFRNTRSWKGGPFSDMLVAEFYMDGNENIIASHYGRGSSSGLAKHNQWWRSIPIAGSLLARGRARWERKTWIERVRSIIDEAER